MTQIAIVATGDELVDGEVLNTNGQYIAQCLSSYGYAIAEQRLSRDDLSLLKPSLASAIKQYPVTVIIGGLGPTNDDLTRHAVADVMALPLVEDPISLSKLQRHYQRHDAILSGLNRQQVLFPQGSEIIDNPFGTANGFIVRLGGHLVYVLPGPPNECLPMFDSKVLGDIRHAIDPQLSPTHVWRLFGQSEGQLASELQAALPTIAEHLGYRWHYPYLDVKYRAQSQSDIDALSDLLQGREICHATETASQRLHRLVQHTEFPKLVINDRATGGALQHAIHTPKTAQKVFFDNECAQATDWVALDGLEDYWQGDAIQRFTPLTLKACLGGREFSHHTECPNRNNVTIVYASEWSSHVLYQWLKGIDEVVAVRR